MFIEDDLPKKDIIIYLIIGLLISIVCGLIFFNHKLNDKQSLVVEEGVLNLSNWNWVEDDAVRLTGEWEFYPKQLLTPQDFSDSSLLDSNLDYRNPAENINYQSADNNVSGEKYFTYRSNIKLPSDLTEPLAVKVPRTRGTALKVWINGESFTEIGAVGQSKVEMTPGWETEIINFKPQSSEVEIIIQGANHYYKTGVANDLLLGTKEQIKQKRESGIVVNMLWLGSLLLLTVYYLILFIFRPDAKHLLYLGLLGIISSIRMTALGEAYLADYFNFSYNVVSNILLSYYLVIPILGLLIFSLYPQEFSKKVLVSSQILGISIYVFILIVPLEFASFRLFFELIILFFICYYLYSIILAVTRQREEALLFLLSYSCFFLTIINELWNGMQIVGKGYFLQLGLFGFLLFQSLFVTRKFLKGFYNLEKIIQKLKKKNNSLKQKDQSKDEFVNNTAQKLQLPLNDIVSAVESIIHSNASSLSATVRNDLGLIINRGHGLGYMLNNLIDYFKLKQETIKIREEKLDVYEIIEYVIKFFKPFINEKDISFNNNIEAEQYIIKGDRSRLIQVFYNLLDDVANKIKKGVLSFAVVEKNNRIQIKLKVNAENILFKYQDNISCFNCKEQIVEEKLDIRQSVTQKLIKLQAGELNIRKETNKTLVLTVSLPGFKKHGEVEAVARKNEEEADGTKSKDRIVSGKSKQERSVMIITNQSTDLEFWQETLNLKEYQLQIFTDRKKAFKEINNNTLLIILNLFALNKSDLELCQKIRDRFTVFELPILTMAARSKPENLIKGFELGINEFIRKPFVLSELKARIKTLITLKERVEESFKREQDFLRAQINPHFLYNTLDTIAYLCKKNPEQASDLIIELAQYLRYSFNFENLSQTVSINKELDLLKFYLTIQQARFPDKVKVEYEIEDNLNFSLPPLALQTIVENAIKHGILKQKEGGIVKIEIKELAHNFLIKVADNGVGMTAEKINSLFAENNEQQSSIGLKNVNKRLKKIYNRELIISSDLEQGTTVKFKIPKTIN